MNTVGDVIRKINYVKREKDRLERFLQEELDGQKIESFYLSRQTVEWAVIAFQFLIDNLLETKIKIKEIKHG